MERVGIGGVLTIVFGAVAVVIALAFSPQPAGWFEGWLRVSSILARLMSGLAGVAVSFILVCVALAIFGRAADEQEVPSRANGLYNLEGVLDAMWKTALNFAEGVEKLHIELEKGREPSRANQAKAHRSALRKLDYDLLQCDNRHLRDSAVLSGVPQEFLEARTELQNQLADITSKLRPRFWRDPEGCLAKAARRASILAEKARAHARAVEEKKEALGARSQASS